MKKFNMTGKEQPPVFMKKLNDRISKCWSTIGAIGCKIVEIETNKYEIIFFPGVREYVGGSKDGEQYFTGFHFNIGKFVRVFDKPGPKVYLDCVHQEITEHLMFIGKIDGNDVKVGILLSPPDGENPVEKVHTTGPKKGQIEPTERK